MLLKQLDSYMEKNEFGPFPHIIYKNNSNGSKRAKCKNKTTKLLKEYIGVNFCDLE